MLVDGNAQVLQVVLMNQGQTLQIIPWILYQRSVSAMLVLFVMVFDLYVYVYFTYIICTESNNQISDKSI